MQKFPRLSCTLAVCLSSLLLSAFATAQEVALSDLPQAPAPQQSNAAGPPGASERATGGFFSNYGSVSVNDKLPPQSAGEKFKIDRKSVVEGKSVDLGGPRI